MTKIAKHIEPTNAQSPRITANEVADTKETLEKQIGNPLEFHKKLKVLHSLSYIKNHVRRIHFSPKDMILNTSKIYSNFRAYALQTLKQVCWYETILGKIRIKLSEMYPDFFQYDTRWNKPEVLIKEQEQQNEIIRQRRKQGNSEGEHNDYKLNFKSEEALIFTAEENPLFIEFVLYILLIEKDEKFIEWVSQLNENLNLCKEYQDILHNHIKWMKYIIQIRYQCEEILQQFMADEKKHSIDEFIPQILKHDAIILPKYVRPNRHKRVSSKQVEDILIQNGLQMGISIEDTKEKCVLGYKTHPIFFPDDLIPGLYVIPHDFPVHQIEEFNSGRIIVQDKSSCLPPYVLVETLKKLKYLNNPKQKISIVDACAAPGNKTSLLGELLLDYPNAVVYATEIDKRRYEMLQNRMKQFGAKNIKVYNTDFLKFNFRSNKTIKAIMLDPSCSGSGMTGRDTYFDDNTIDRVEKLAGFQERVLRHSLKQPNVEVVVYSTCSIHDRENEIVMKNVKEQAEADGKKYEYYPVLPQLKMNRGRILDEACKHCNRCARFDATQDYCGGFFVGCFVRESSLIHRDPTILNKKSGSKRKSSQKELNASQLARKQRRIELRKELYGK